MEILDMRFESEKVKKFKISLINICDTEVSFSIKKLKNIQACITC